MTKKDKQQISGNQRGGSQGVKAPMLFALVLGFHAAAIGTFLVVSGCSTKPPPVDPPPAPIMPPRMETEATPVQPRPIPTFRPPVAVEQPATSLDAATQTYKIQKGDSLSKIAARHGITANELAALNNISNPNLIRIGQTLALPAHATPSSSPAPAASRPTPSPAPAATASGASYTVVAGDNLTKIARAHGVTIAALRSANNLSSDVIRIGQKLVIPGASASSAPAAPAPAPAAPAPSPAPVVAPAPAPIAPAPATVPDEPASALDFQTSLSDVEPFPYIIKQNDTVDSIARTFGVLPADLLEVNNLTEAEFTAGKQIKIPWND
jgi:LysM repeat protein